MLTTASGPDVAPYHNRQVVVLRPEDWSASIHLAKTEAELLQPLPGGALEVTTVREGTGWRLRPARCPAALGGGAVPGGVCGGGFGGSEREGTLGDSRL
jgi:hypothetical protein